MRQIHRERVRRDIEPVPRGSQVLEQLHLVVPVIHKPLVEQRRRRRVPQQHVRLLEVREEAAHLHERDIRGDGEPIGKDVELRVRRFPREYVCADAGLGGETGLGVETGLERGFVGRKVLESEESAVVEGLAAIEDLLAVEEEDREDGGDAAVVRLDALFDLVIIAFELVDEEGEVGEDAFAPAIRVVLHELVLSVRVQHPIDV